MPYPSGDYQFNRYRLDEPYSPHSKWQEMGRRKGGIKVVIQPNWIRNGVVLIYTRGNYLVSLLIWKARFSVNKRNMSPSDTAF